MSKKNKRVEILNEPKTQKHTKSAIEPNNYDKLPASWGFSKLIRGGKWDVSADDWKIWNNKILPQLMKFEGMTWAQIKVIPKDGKNGGNKHHHVPIESFTEAGKKEVKKYNLHYDEMFSLRLSNLERIFGVLDKGILHIIWYDDKHEICKIKNR